MGTRRRRSWSTLADGASTGGDGVTVDGRRRHDRLQPAPTGSRGSLGDGQLVVDTDDEELVRLVLDGVSITSTTTSPLEVIDADEVVAIVARRGSQNALADAEAYQFASADVDEPNAALFSTADLTIGGDGRPDRRRAATTTASPARTGWSSPTARSR